MIGKAGEGATVIHRFAATQETSLSSFTHRSLSAGVGGSFALEQVAPNFVGEEG